MRINKRRRKKAYCKIMKKEPVSILELKGALSYSKEINTFLDHVVFHIRVFIKPILDYFIKLWGAIIQEIA